MNKSVNMVLRIVGVVAAIAACVFAYLLKGKVDQAMQNTAWTTTDAEILANKQFDARMVDINTKAKALLEAKRTKITELEGNVKDLTADVADKKQKIEGLTANVTTLEGERADLTRKRDELNGQLAEANSKKDSLTSELNAAKEELAKHKEKIAALFTKEQLDAEIAKANKAEESRNTVTQKYARLWNTYKNDTGNNPTGFTRDPLVEEKADSLQVEFGPETLKARIIVVDPSKGFVSFSVGELNDIKPNSNFTVLVNNKTVGQVRVESVQAAMCTAQITPFKDKDKDKDKTELDKFVRGGVVTLVPFSGKISDNVAKAVAK